MPSFHTLPGYRITYPNTSYPIPQSSRQHSLPPISYHITSYPRLPKATRSPDNSVRPNPDTSHDDPDTKPTTRIPLSDHSALIPGPIGRVVLLNNQDFSLMPSSTLQDSSLIEPYNAPAWCFNYLPNQLETQQFPETGVSRR